MEKILMVDNKRIGKSLAVVIGIMLIDALFHTFYTHPFETNVYFIVKAALIFVIAYNLFGKPATDKRVWVHAIIFMLLFSIYYRSLEVVFGLPWGARVPDIEIGSLLVTYDTRPLLSSLIWGIVHGGAFLLSAFFIRKK